MEGGGWSENNLARNVFGAKAALALILYPWVRYRLRSLLPFQCQSSLCQTQRQRSHELHCYAELSGEERAEVRSCKRKIDRRLRSFIQEAIDDGSITSCD